MMNNTQVAFFDAIKRDDVKAIIEMKLPNNSNVIRLGLLLAIKNTEMIKAIIDKSDLITKDMFAMVLQHLIYKNCYNAAETIINEYTKKCREFDEETLKESFYCAILSKNCIMVRFIYNHLINKVSLIEAWLKDEMFCNAVITSNGDITCYIICTLKLNIDENCALMIISLSILYERFYSIHCLDNMHLIPKIKDEATMTFSKSKNPFVYACSSIVGKQALTILKKFVSEKTLRDGIINAISVSNYDAIEFLMKPEYAELVSFKNDDESVSRINMMLRYTKNDSFIICKQLNDCLEKQKFYAARIYLRHDAKIDAAKLINILVNVEDEAPDFCNAYAIIYELIYMRAYKGVVIDDICKLLEPHRNVKNDAMRVLINTYYELQIEPLIADLGAKIPKICETCGCLKCD
ncbi:MAG: hypothetical protein ACYCPT_07015 [Acidimicrobiales bacterium]